MTTSPSAAPGAGGSGSPATPQRVGDAGALNAADYRMRAQDKLAQHPELAAFAAQLDDSLPGTNVDAEKVCHFDDADRLLHRRALCIAEAGGDEVAGLAAFEAEYWSTRRQAFEDLWHLGRRFVYCAPNPGTLGAQKYGAYCLILDPMALEQRDTAIFPADTAQNYTDDKAVVHADRVQKDVGSWPTRADMALVHYGDKAVPLTPEQRAELIGGADTYMEVVTVGSLLLSQVTALRVDKNAWEEHDDLWWRWMDDLLTDPADIARAKAYDALLGWEDRGMRIIVVDDT